MLTLTSEDMSILDKALPPTAGQRYSDQHMAYIES